MMRALVLLHRWLGVAFCLLFTMWFATGIVMHFVGFPALTEAARLAGLGPVDLGRVAHSPTEAVGASGITDATRVRLIQRSDGPVYLVSNLSRVTSLHAADLSDAAVHTQQLALATATEYVRNRQWDAVRADVAGVASYDQWTLSGGFDLHRPLYRVALDDRLGTELYVSATTGEVVLDTTRRQRSWNYVGGVAHWIYPTALRSHPAAWSLLVWWLSLLALIGATIGAVVGAVQIRIEALRQAGPYRGVQAWHHWFGLICAPFVLTWTFSGWLSMDNGRLFSTGEPTAAEAATITGVPAWDALPRDEVKRVAGPAKEVEWFAFGGRIYRRERIGLGQQRLALVDALADTMTPNRAFLQANEIAVAASNLAPACNAPVAIDPSDDYAFASIVPSAPIFRVVCGGDWFHVDGASGALLETLDASRRAYRWSYSALHTLDFPALTARPALRATLIVMLCGCGFIFSLTGVVIGWRRLLSCFRSPEGG